MSDILIFTDIVNEVAGPHIESLKNEYGFPGECALSSHLIGGYLQKEFDVNIVYGTFGDDGFFHCWLEYKGVIVDFTLFQFLTRKKRQSFYQKSTAKEILDYMLEHQESYFIHQQDDRYYDYNPITYVPSVFENSYMPSEFKHTCGIKESYEKFLQKSKEQEIYINLSWYHSRDINNITFHQLLEQLNLKLSRKFGTKWVIRSLKNRTKEITV
ncbi:hypothetical protein COA01_34995 [Bacillus cereus]|uniref:hypothetical protein n=1 Tax=Bacillus cereus TaxID=1396 RepID=UPI000BFC9B8B|nr:hypothetical protein [Bacillus cereus]PGP12030.1 hypothetical protein COA01_34995 [Bacillus cereus]